MGSADVLSPGAAAALRRLVATNDPAGAVRLADDLVGDGEYGAAREVLQQAGREWPDERRIVLRQLELDLRYRRWREFDATMASALVQHPASGALRMLEARGHEERHDFGAAVDAYRAAAAVQPDDAEPIVRGTRALRALGRADEAVAWAGDALRRMEDAGLRAALGYALIQEGEPRKAAESFLKAHRLQPDWGPYLEDLAGALMLAERWKDTVRAARRALQRNARSERAWTAYAVGHQNLGDAERAEKGFRNALACARAPGRAKGNYGLWLARRPDRVLEADRMLREALEEHPEWDEVREALARHGAP